jgi:hypothetical protein
MGAAATGPAMANIKLNTRARATVTAMILDFKIYSPKYINLRPFFLVFRKIRPGLLLFDRLSRE